LIAVILMVAAIKKQAGQSFETGFGRFQLP
jgi:hypothetical protein